MFKIGEFSKLSMLTIKALRFYEKEGLLIPARVDEWSGYRFYEASQGLAAVEEREYSGDFVMALLNKDTTI